MSVELRSGLGYHSFGEHFRKRHITPGSTIIVVNERMSYGYLVMEDGRLSFGGVSVRNPSEAIGSHRWIYQPSERNK